MNETPKPALHHSMLATLSKCGMQVYYRWVENIKIPPSFALHVGSAVHRAAELDLRRKMETGQQAHLAEVVDRASYLLDARNRADDVTDRVDAIANNVGDILEDVSKLGMCRIHRRSLSSRQTFCAARLA